MSALPQPEPAPALLPTAPRSSSPGRDALAALSLANLLAITMWARQLDPATLYFLHETRPPAAYLASIAVVLVTGALGTLAAALARRTPARLGVVWDLLFAFAVAVAIRGLRDQVTDFVGSEHRHAVRTTLDVLAALPVLLAMSPLRARARRALLTGLLVLSPFAALTSLHALRLALTPPALEPRAPAARVASSGGPRVVVLLFDELDELMAFEDRKPGISAPALDALAARAYHPTRTRFAAARTEYAVPSLLTGRRVVGIRDAGPSDRLLLFEDGSRELFSETRTFLGDATRAGKNVALTGWYHPYCRVLGDDAVSCVSRSNRRETQGASFAEALLRQSAAFVDSLPHGKKLIRHAGIEALRHQLEISPAYQLESWKRLHAASREAAADPQIDLAFLHYPIPHPPGIWDAEADRFVTAFRRGGAISSNLELVDRTVAELLADMESAGVLARTALVVLADHPKRGKGLTPMGAPTLPPGEMRPVTFLVRLPGDPDGVLDPEARFNNMALHALVPTLLEGRLQRHAELRAFLEAASDAPSPGEKR